MFLEVVSSTSRDLEMQVRENKTSLIQGIVGLRLQHNLHAIILFVIEDLIHLGSLA
jgi:hypothetical protein